MTPAISVVALYAGLLGLGYLLLSLLVIRQRVKHRVGLLDGGVSDLARHIRAHGNFAEFVPFILLLMLLLAMANTSALWLHLLGVMVCVGRISHYVSLCIVEPRSEAKGALTIFLRQIGMVLTFTALTASAIAAISLYL